MDRSELIRRMVLDAICDDENIDQAILPRVGTESLITEKGMASHLSGET
ncbi:MAG: hypothetical protein ABSH09_14875 [Bryobacteraceae bacterium]|jgi:hypothetical protein